MSAIFVVHTRSARIQAGISSALASIFHKYSIDREIELDDIYEAAGDDEPLLGGGAEKSALLARNINVSRSVSRDSAAASSTASSVSEVSTLMEAMQLELKSGAKLTCFEQFLVLWHNPDSLYKSGFNWHHAKWTACT
jgi:hypothetical protein